MPWRRESSLDPEFAEKFLNFIISEVIRHHVRIANEHADQDEDSKSLKLRLSKFTLFEISAFRKAPLIPC